MNTEDPRRREEKERSVGSSHDTGAYEEESIYRSPASNTHAPFAPSEDITYTPSAWDSELSITSSVEQDELDFDSVADEQSDSEDDESVSDDGSQANKCASPNHATNDLISPLAPYGSAQNPDAIASMLCNAGANIMSIQEHGISFEGHSSNFNKIIISAGYSAIIEKKSCLIYDSDLLGACLMNSGALLEGRIIWNVFNSPHTINS